MITKGVTPVKLFGKNIVWHFPLVKNAQFLLDKVAGKLKIKMSWNQKLKDWLRDLWKK